MARVWVVSPFKDQTDDVWNIVVGVWEFDCKVKDPVLGSSS